MEEEVHLLSEDKLYERIVKLNKMTTFYQYKQSEEMIENVDRLLQECYSILDERYQRNYFEQMIGMETGTVLDAETHKQSSGTSEKKSGRRGNTGRII